MVGHPQEITEPDSDGKGQSLRATGSASFYDGASVDSSAEVAQTRADFSTPFVTDDSSRHEVPGRGWTSVST